MVSRVRNYKGLKPHLSGGGITPRAAAHGNGDQLPPFITSVAPGFSPENTNPKTGGTSVPYKLLSLLFPIFLLFHPLYAQEYSNFFPILGGQRAGTSAYTFLKIGVGARAMGMGGAFIAVANDASTLFWNPAGAVQIPQSRGVFVDHNRWVADIQQENMGLIYQFRGIYSLGISAAAIHTDPMEITTEYQPAGTGEYFNYGDVMLGFSYAMKMTDRFSFGLTGKIVDEQLAELHMMDYLVDMGTYYYTGFHHLRFAVALVNFGLPAAPPDSINYLDMNGSPQTRAYESFSPPTIFRLGVANEWLNSPRAELTTSIQLNHPVDNAENVSLGTEFNLNQMFFIRAGYQFNMDVDTWSAGLGLHLAGIQIDYAYTDMRDWNYAQRFSLGWAF